jgi:NTE family protein
VAAQFGSGRPVGDWYRRQVELDLQTGELRPEGMSIERLWELMIRLAEEFPDPIERRRQVGKLALEADTPSEAARRALVAGRLAGLGWPERPVAIVAVDTTTGERRVFDAHSGVDLVDAVAASSAVPGVWPPVTIGDTRYVDGGVYSSCNADLAAGYQRVLVLAPMADGEIDEQTALVNRTGEALVITPDADALAAFGTDPLDPAVRAPAARAGYHQGGRSAAAVIRLWDA